MHTDRRQQSAYARLEGRITALPLWARHLVAVAIVGLTTAIALLLLQQTGDTRLSMVFLGGVLVTGALLGSGPAYVAAAGSFFIYNFFLVEPRFTFTMQTPEDLVTLLMFTAAAGLTSGLAGRIRDQAESSRIRADATAALYDATREFSASSDEDFIRQRLARHLAGVARGAALVRQGFNTHTEPANLLLSRHLILELDAAQRSARTFLATSLGAEDGWTGRVLCVGEVVLGVAAWRPTDRRLTFEEATLVELLADAGAMAILRTRLTAAKSEAETKARTEDLRNAILSSISHDMRTPLAAIMASAGSLRRYDDKLEPAARIDLAITIEEEAARLDDSLANLLSMAQLEAGQISVRRVPFNPIDIAEKVLATQGGGRPCVRLAGGFRPAKALGDPLLFQQALAKVVENARRYAPASDAIEVRIERAGRSLAVEVRDQGPGVDPDELPRIFEKFFRAGAALTQRGTGLGLAIARGFMESMGGTITAENRQDGQSGLVVRLILPGQP